MRSNRTASVAFVYSCVFMASAACGDAGLGPSGPGTSPDAVSAALAGASKSISTAEVANGVVVGAVRQLPVPTVALQPGHSVAPALVWQSSNDAVASVSSSGVVTARSVGTTTVTATAWDVAGTWTITVIPSTATRIVLRTSSLSAGDTVTAHIESSVIKVSSVKNVVWQSANAHVATVTASGLVKAVGAGATTISATASGMAISTPVTVVDPTMTIDKKPAADTAPTPAPAPTPTPAPAPAPAPVPAPTAAPVAGAITLGVRRLESGSGTALVSNGIPLQPGALFASQLRNVKVLVNGVEQSIYIEALAGTHSDGSLRSVLVEFNYSLSGTAPVAGQLVLGQPRTTADLAKPSDSRTIPVAVALPTDPTYLVKTLIVGPMLTSAQTSVLSPTFAKYESDFVSYADKLWGLYGSNWESANYYDRANTYYAFWARTGNVEYYRRATLIAVNYRKNYLEASNYGPSSYWYMPEGQETHYLLTGDEASRTAVGYSADVFLADYYQSGISSVNAEMENRVQGRVIMAMLTAWKINAPSRQGANWAATLRADLPKILGTQGADGAYRFTAPNAGQCGYNKPFMVGILNTALIKYNTYFEKDARILPAVQKAADYMWTKNWIASGSGFMYLEASCVNPNGGSDGPYPAPDLDNLIVDNFGWLYQQTGNSAYRTEGDQVFTGGVNNAWLDGTKQFNENYGNSFRYSYYRQ